MLGINIHSKVPRPVDASGLCITIVHHIVHMAGLLSAFVVDDRAVYCSPLQSLALDSNLSCLSRPLSSL